MTVNKQLWNNFWNEVISSQENWNEMCRINVISCLLDLSKYNNKECSKILTFEEDREIPIEDLRVIVALVCLTTSGKDLSGRIAREILSNLGYMTSRSTDFTTSAVVGGTNFEALKYNREHNLSEEHPISENISGSKQYYYRNPVVYGVLYHTHYWTITEMELIFKSGQYREGILTAFRQALDNDRLIEKDLSGNHIKYITPTNFLFATYPKDKIIYFLMDTGLFQRMLFYYNDIDKRTEEIENHQIEHINITPKKLFESEDFEKLVENFKTQFKDIDISKIEIKDEVKVILKNRRDKLKEKYGHLSAVDISILNSVMRRSINIIRNIARCYAVDNKSMIISETEINQAFDLFEICFLSLKNFLVKMMDDVSKFKVVLLEIFGKNKNVSKKELLEGLQKAYGIKEGMAYIKIKEAVKLGLIGNSENKEIALRF